MKNTNFKKLKLNWVIINLTLFLQSIIKIIIKNNSYILKTNTVKCKHLYKEVNNFRFIIIPLETNILNTQELQYTSSQHIETRRKSTRSNLRKYFIFKFKFIRWG